MKAARRWKTLLMIWNIHTHTVDRTREEKPQKIDKNTQSQSDRIQNIRTYGVDENRLIEIHEVT